MRLSHEQRQVIQAAAVCFGLDATVKLFGSRVDDSARGGDIDLLINTSMTDPDEIVRAEIAFQLRLQQALGEQRIDLLIDYPSRRERPPIFAVAARTGVLL